jgi:hypothetical protein
MESEILRATLGGTIFAYHSIRQQRKLCAIAEPEPPALSSYFHRNNPPIEEVVNKCRHHRLTLGEDEACSK